MSLLSCLLADAAQCHNPPEEDLALVQTCLEYGWGLRYGGLQDHIKDFHDTRQLLVDERFLVLPHKTNINQLMARDIANCRDAYSYPILEAYHGETSFTYLVMPLAPTVHAELSPKVVHSDLPPHLIMVVTRARLSRAFPNEHPPTINGQVSKALGEAYKRLSPTHDFLFATQELRTMRSVTGKWFDSFFIPNHYRQGWPFPLPIQPRPPPLPVQIDPRMENWTFPPEPRRCATPEELAAEIVLKPMKPEDVAKYGGWHLDVEGFRRTYRLPPHN